MALLGLFKRRTLEQRIKAGIANMRRWGDSEPFDFEWEVRRDRLALNYTLLNNSIYRRQADGGQREIILKEVFGLECTDDTRILGYFNPVRTIVDAYQNVFRGNYGQEIRVDDKVDEQPVNPKLADAANSPIRRLWRWSNLDTQKQVLQEWAANLGTVGIRVVASSDADVAHRRVWLQFDHPSTIVDFNEDGRGNITEIDLRYSAIAGDLGERRFDVEVREVITREGFVKEIEGRNVLEADQRKNALGVCPYVLLRHRDDGHEFGRWAYEGSEDIIHGLNWLISNQGESVIEYAWAQWFAAAGGKSPSQFKMGRKNVAYVQMDPDTPTPIFTPLVPDVDQAGSRDFWVEILTRLIERQPEMLIGSLKALSGQSGETIAKLLMPAEAKIRSARAQYEHAMIRALQLGISEGIRLSLWDVGTGMGSVEAAERAYSQGKEDFAFAERPALPLSALDETQRADAEQARKMAKLKLAKQAGEMVDHEERLRLAGYSASEIRDILARQRSQDVIPTEEL